MPERAVDEPRPHAPVEIQALTRADAHWHLDGLCALLRDGVADGAALGFLAPPDRSDAERDWDAVQEALGEHQRLWIAREGARVVGCVRLLDATEPSGRHRATVERLLVTPARRGRGIARALLAAVEREALSRERTLLVADVETDSPAHRALLRLGWLEAGTVPGHAMSPGGGLRASTRVFRHPRAHDLGS